MVDRNAKNISFMARSSTDPKQAAILFDDMRKAGTSAQVIRSDAIARIDFDNFLNDI